MGVGAAALASAAPAEDDPLCVVGELAGAAGDVAEPLVLLEPPCRANSHTPASRHTATRTI